MAGARSRASSRGRVSLDGARQVGEGLKDDSIQEGSELKAAATERAGKVRDYVTPDVLEADGASDLGGEDDVKSYADSAAGESGEAVTEPDDSDAGTDSDRINDYET